VVVGVGLFTASGWACPMCKAFVADEPGAQDQARMAQGFFYSILTMLCMPLVLIGSIGSAIYLNARKTQKERQS